MYKVVSEVKNNLTFLPGIFACDLCRRVAHVSRRAPRSAHPTAPRAPGEHHEIALVSGYRARIRAFSFLRSGRMRGAIASSRVVARRSRRREKTLRCRRSRRAFERFSGAMARRRSTGGAGRGADPSRRTFSKRSHHDRREPFARARRSHHPSDVTWNRSSPEVESRRRRCDARPLARAPRRAGALDRSPDAAVESRSVAIPFPSSRPR